MAEVGTLKELGVGAGDVVECVSGSLMHHHRVGDRYTCTIKDGELIVRSERGWFSSVEDDSWMYRIISRATPKLWRDMPPEEKGGLLLAAHEGKVIECLQVNGEWYEVKAGWNHKAAYRIKPEPKVETVEFTGHIDAGMFFRGLNSVKPQVRITFNLIDGKPDCDSVKMEVV